MAANLTCDRLLVGHIVDIDRFKPRVTSQNLRRLPKGAEERSSHVVAIAKPGLACHHVDRMAALLHQRARPLHPKVFDRFGRGLARLGVKGPRPTRSSAQGASLPKAGRLRRLGQPHRG